MLSMITIRNGAEYMGSRLDAAGIRSIVWQEDEDGLVYADGLQGYEIDNDCELTIFQGDRCVSIQRFPDLDTAVSVAEASERVCRWNIKQGAAGNGAKVNEFGWKV